MATNQIKAINALTEELNAVKAKRQYVLVEGGLVQYGSDSVDVIDIDFADKGQSYGLDETEEAMHALSLMNRHGFRKTNTERGAVVDFLGACADMGFEVHGHECDRFLSWLNANDPYRDADDEGELFDCNQSCSEVLGDPQADIEQFEVIDVNQRAERA